MKLTRNLDKLQVYQDALDEVRGEIAHASSPHLVKILASAHSHLNMFDEACSTLKEALDLSRRCDDKKSTEVASRYEGMAIMCQEQARAIIAKVDSDMHIHVDQLDGSPSFARQQGAGARAAENTGN